MIAKLKGHIDSLAENTLILDVGGVGYLVQASAKTLGRLPGRGEAASLLIETQVREDAITLFGFMDGAEKDMFTLLTSVQGVGAKVGLAILSVMTPDQVSAALAAQDKAAVAQANGVGPKLAGRIVNELKDKVAGFVLAEQGIAPAASVGAAAAGAEPSLVSDIVSALVNLGYRQTDAHGAAVRAIARASEGASLASLIPVALKELSNHD